MVECYKGEGITTERRKREGKGKKEEKKREEKERGKTKDQKQGTRGKKDRREGRRKGPEGGRKGKQGTRRKGPQNKVEIHLSSRKRANCHRPYIPPTYSIHSSRTFGRPLNADIAKEFPRVKNIDSTHALQTKQLALTVAPCPYSPIVIGVEDLWYVQRE